MSVGIKRLCGLLLGLVALVVVSVSGLLATQAGSQWLLNRIPGLTVQGFTGVLGGAWQAQQIRWSDGADQVVVMSPEMRLNASCLLRLTLCIETLKSAAITLDFAPSDTDSDSTPFSLPALKLPLQIELGEVQIASLSVNGSEHLQDAQLSAHWTAKGLQIDKLLLRSADLSLKATGTLLPQGTWPLQLNGELSLPAVDQQAWQLTFEVNGDLQQRLNLKADSSGYLTAHAEGWLQPLADHLPAQLQISAETFKGSRELPDTLNLEQLDIHAQGDLEQGYRVNGKAMVAAAQGHIPLSLDAVVKADGLELHQLALTASEQQKLNVAGQLKWLDDLSAESQVAWQDFPWERLYPLGEPLPVKLKQLNAELSYANGNYLGHFTSELNGPAGEFSLQSPVSGDLSAVHLPELKLQAGQGNAQGQVSLDFAEALKWRVHLELSQLDPSYWLAEMPGNLAGTLDSQGELEQFSANVQLKGRLRDLQSSLQVDYKGSLSAGELSQLDLQMGSNRISGKGSLGEKLNAQLNIKLPQLAQLWPGLTGQINGQLDAAGTLQAPQGNVNLAGSHVGYEQHRIARLDLTARMDNRQRTNLTLAAQGIASGDTQLGQLVLSGSGDLRQQQLQLDVDGPQLKAHASIQGQYSKDRWHGNLQQAELVVGTQTWSLQQQASIERIDDGQLNIGAHCWQSEGATLCGRQQRLLPQPKLDMTLGNFPLATLQPWFPEDFQWQGQLNGSVQLEITDAGPSGYVKLDAGSGIWRVQDPQKNWLDFAYGTFALDVQLKPDRVNADFVLHGPSIGELQFKSQINPRLASKPVTGSFSLNGLELAIIRPFVPKIEALSGQLRGSGQLGGTLMSPQVNGSLRLVDGAVSGSELPLNLEKIQALAQLHGQQLQLDGDWRSGEVGQGTLKGVLNWANGLSANVDLNGTKLPVSIEPYANLEVSTELHLSLHDDQMALRGEVSVPSGAIKIRELPPSTVKLSSDAYVVGDVHSQSSMPAIAMDITVRVGQDKLTFKGFGLTADVSGQVHIGNDLDTRGELSLSNGKFSAYGQRLTVRRARMLFTGRIDHPYIDVEAVRKVGDVTAGLRLAGNVEQPTSTVFSEPAMSQEQALSYLILGRPLNQSSGDNNLLAQAALALGMAGGAPIINRFAQGLGFSDFSLDTEGSGATTSVVANGKLSERLSVRYGVGVFEPGDTIALRYELTRRLYLEAASGLSSSLDVVYRRDF